MSSEAQLQRRLTAAGFSLALAEALKPKQLRELLAFVDNEAALTDLRCGVVGGCGCGGWLAVVVVLVGT
jgi:hypothetical protein